MTDFLARRKASIAPYIDAAALHAATHPRYTIVANFGSTQSPGQVASNVGGYYNTAGGKIIDSTGTGSPAATTFGNEEAAALNPQFQQQQQQLAAKEAAMGITGSGAAKADFSDLGGQQAATLAGAIAPLYQSAEGSYDTLQGQEAGAQSQAYENTYNQQQQQYMQMLQMFAGAAGDAFGLPGVGGGGNPYSDFQTTPQGGGIDSIPTPGIDPAYTNAGVQTPQMGSYTDSSSPSNAVSYNPYAETG